MLNIYLDQNKWIDLAKAYHGRQDGQKFAPALQASFLATEQDRARFPLSVMHYMEVGKSSQGDRRLRLAKVMAQLSRAQSIVSGPGIMKDLLAFWFSKAYGLNATPLEPQIFGKGINFAFGESAFTLKERFEQPILTSFLEDQLNSVEAIEWLLSHPEEVTRNTSVADLRTREEELAKHANSVRQIGKDYGREARWKSYSLSLIWQIRNEILDAFKMIQTSPGGFFENEVLLFRLLDEIPPLQVERELVVERDFHWDRPAAGNDMIDIAAISMAVPYCDVVVTEKFWANILKRLDLDKRYQTRITTDACELEDILRL